MEILTQLWDKTSPINGVTAERLHEKFIDENDNDDRVMFMYDGIIGRIQYVDNREFNADEKEYMNSLISSGVDEKQAIVDTWLYKAKNESVESIISKSDE